MKKLLLSALVLVPAMAFAAEFTSPGNGTTYTLQSLSEIDTCGVTLESAGVYVMTENVNIANGDSFNLESGVTLKMGDGVQFYADGVVQMNCTKKTTITRNAETDNPKGFYIATETPVDTMFVNNVKFDYAGFRTFFVGKAKITNCEFYNNNGKNNSQGALTLGPSDGEYIVRNCKFVSNTVPAIGVAANYLIGLTIEDCEFEDNNTSNTNKPQVNITVGGEKDIIIRNCAFIGNKRDKVGGISVANMLGMAGTHNVIIEGNRIIDHRYGMTFTNGPMNLVIKDNVLFDNKYETNAMNGGSGISLYDPYAAQDVYIEGNYIEGHLWGITVIGGKNVNMGKTYNPTAADYNPGKNEFYNNGNGGVLYDLYNNGKSTIFAQGNTWGVDEQTNEQIEGVISHKNDDASLGFVVYSTKEKAVKMTTLGDNTAYSLKSLSEIDTCGVMQLNDSTFLMTHDVTIAANDSFKMDDGATLMMSTGNVIRIDGQSDFACTKATSITRAGAADLPKGLYLANEDSLTQIKIDNMNFDYAGVRAWIQGQLEVTNCTFRYNNGKNSSSGALSLAKDGATFIVKKCNFIQNEVPAIGGGANMATGIIVEDCYLEDNNTKNSNKPQLNLTVGGDNDIVIRNCTLKGAQRTKVGAIAVSNMMGLPGTNNVLIEGNYMDNHRYGITTNGTMNVRIINNEMIDNKYETNAMNGGSGISIYDSKYNQDVYIEGNTIDGHLWGITVIGGKNVNIGKTGDPNAADYNPGNNIFKNNGNNDKLYDLYNNGTNTVYAQGNTWNVDEQTAEKIEEVITHKVDNESLGLVIFMPEENAVEEIEVDDNTPAVYYNVQGVKVDKPENGLFIKVQGNKATKVVL